jgi:ADP-Ribosyltransferase in polyvalent proteins
MAFTHCGAEIKALMKVSDDDVKVIEDKLAERLALGEPRALAQRHAVADAIAMLGDERQAALDAIEKKIGKPKAAQEEVRVRREAQAKEDQEFAALAVSAYKKELSNAKARGVRPSIAEDVAIGEASAPVFDKLIDALDNQMLGRISRKNGISIADARKEISDHFEKIGSFPHEDVIDFMAEKLGIKEKDYGRKIYDDLSAKATKITEDAIAKFKIDSAQSEAKPQEAATAAPAKDADTGLPLNADGTVTVYHHTSKAAADAIQKTGTLKAQAEPDVYVTTHKETDTGYGDTAVAINVDPAKLTLDDEFPDGRKDFRLNVGKPGGSIKVAIDKDMPAFSRANPQTDTPAFKAWFKDSKVVDAQGKPLVVYHGAPDVRGIFSEGFKPKMRGEVFFASDSQRVANTYADANRAWDYQNAEDHVVPLYLSLQNPMVIDAKGMHWKRTEETIDKAKEAGHDGVIIKNSLDDYNNGTSAKPSTVYAFFNSTQAKSAITDQLKSRVDGKLIDGATGNNGTFDPTNPDIRYSQGKAATGLPTSQVQSITDGIKAKWANAPEIIVASNMDDKAIPQAVRDHNNAQLSQGAEGSPEGFLYGGKVYLIADQLNMPTDVMRVLFHETLGHVGLRGVFGKELTPILQQIAMFRKAEVQAKAKEYGLDMSKESDRLQAAEEVLAVLAQTKPELGFVKRAVAAIRTWLKAHGFKLELSDNDIIANYILPAKNWVQSGKEANFNGDSLRNSLKAGNWYSELGKQVLANKSSAMPSGMWAGWIESLKTKGVKPDEIEWSGVQDWLKLQTGKVTKADVANYLNQNGVQVQETVLGRNDGASDEINDYLPEGSRVEGLSTKYSQYQLPGGTNYREVLLTLPEAKHSAQPKGEVVEDGKDKDYPFAIMVEGKEVNRSKTGGEVAQDILKEEIERVAGKVKRDNNYKSSHWEQPNVLAHIRLNDRVDADGNKVLFVEELQSDWNADGRKNGFGSAQNKADLPMKAVFDSGYWEVSFSDGTFITNVMPSDVIGEDTINTPRYRAITEEEAISVARDRLRAGGNRTGMNHMVPTAPFVTATDKWLSLALKRVVKMAVDGNYDKVAFVNGEQSAERYDLSKQIEQVEARKSGNLYQLLVTDKTGSQVIDEDYSADKLPDVVGKDLAEKIIADGGGTYSGLDLKVGGEGMKAFYDKIVPNTTKEVIRKLGGGAMENVVMKGATNEHDYYHDKDKGYVVIDGNNKEVGRFDTSTKAVNEVDRLNEETSQSQPGFTITPAMKDKASGGMPLFSRQQSPMTAKTLTLSLVDEALRVTAPMGLAPSEVRASIKQYSSDRRLAQYRFSETDDFLKKNFTEAQQKKMWEAADEENDLRRNVSSPSQMAGKGLDALTQKERTAVEDLHDAGNKLFQRAKDIGLISGDGVPFWTPRMMVMVDPQTGEFSAPISSAKGMGQDSLKISTSAASAKHRKYDYSKDTQAAMQAKGGDLVKNIRAMPMAMARLESAIAGRELVNEIKSLGQAVGQEWISPSAQEGFVVANHPAFSTMRPRFETDTAGNPIKDQFDHFIPKYDAEGNPIMDRQHMYVRRDIDAAMRAALSSEDGKIYTGLMLLKSKAMSGIMISPLIHNMVIAGKAVAMHPLDLPLIYARGYMARKNIPLVETAIHDGLVLVAQKNTSMDVTDLTNPLGKEGGLGDINESWISHGAGALVGLANKKAGVATKAGLDKVGDFWHGTLLWNRIADLQMGLYQNAKTTLVKKGFSEREAGIMAAHIANRYGGALPKENMSELSRKFANISLFSRSFTLGNIGIMKDVLTGLPSGEKALLEREMGSNKEGFSKAVNVMRRKAFLGLVVDAAFAMIAMSLFQDWKDPKNKDRPFMDVLGDYSDRAGKMLDNIHENPAKAGSYNPLRLMSQYNNEPGKQSRAFAGVQDNGRGLYLRLPTGKVIEELFGWTTHFSETLSAKLSPTVKSVYQSATNDAGFGHPVFDENDNTAKIAISIAKHIVKSHFASDVTTRLNDYANGVATPMDMLALEGAATGITPSQGYPGGPEAGVIAKSEKESKMTVDIAKVKAMRELKYGNEDKARSLLEDAGLTPKEVSKIINRYESPKQGASSHARKWFGTHSNDEQKIQRDAVNK